jgi:folate-binding protein YgfZ
LVDIGGNRHQERNFARKATPRGVESKAWFLGLTSALEVPLFGQMSEALPSFLAELPHLGLARFTGADALAFLQGQVSNDTRLLKQGQCLRAAYSSPQGRVLALIYLVPTDDGALAVLPRELIAPTLERLKKFVLRAKVSMEDVSASWMVAGAQGADALKRAGLDGASEESAYREQDGIGIARISHAGSRYFLLGSRERMAALPLSIASTETETSWRLADIESGLPQIYAATSEVFVAQMLNLDVLDGISFSKGCYTGQEIIARTQHLGRIKRRMSRFELPRGEWHIGQTIYLNDGRHGKITELAARNGNMEALAVLTLPAAEGESEESRAADEAVKARELALPYSLAVTNQ